MNPVAMSLRGDLKIVEDREVINVFRKGPKFRSPSKINWTDCRNTIEKALIAYCKRWCKREHAPENVLSPILMMKICIRVQICTYANLLTKYIRMQKLLCKAFT